MTDAYKIYSWSSFQAATKGVTPPWFKVRSPHTLLLTGFPAEPKGLYDFAWGISSPYSCSAVVKRLGETQSSPDLKRMKINQPPDSTQKATDPTSSPAPSTQPAPTMQLQVSNPSNPSQPQPSAQEPIDQRMIYMKVQQINGEIQKLNENYNLAMEQARPDVAARIKAVRDTRLLLLDKIKLSLAEYMRRNTAQQQLQASNGTATNSQLPPSGINSFAAPANAQDVSRGSDTQSLQQMVQNRAGGAGGPPFELPNTAVQGGLPNMTPEMKGQMLKLMEGRGIRPPQPPVLHQVAQPNVPGPSAAPQVNPNHSTWEGELSWNGVDVATQTPKNMQTQVKLSSTSGDMYVSA